MIYLGISETCDVGYLVFEPESRTVRTVYNVVFDETFKQRGNALRTYDAARKLGKSAPDFVEELVFDGTDPGLLAGAVRRLFTESKVQNPASEVMSTNQNGKPQPSTLKQGGRQAYPIG